MTATAMPILTCPTGVYCGCAVQYCCCAGAMWLSSHKQHGGSAWGLCLAAALCVLLPATALSQMLAAPDQVLVVSVGTRKRAELQETQKQTFAKHLETWYYDEVDILLHVAALSAMQQPLVKAVGVVGSTVVSPLSSHSMQRSALPR